MSNLTDRQKEILSFIEYFIKENGFSPTVRIKAKIQVVEA